MSCIMSGMRKSGSVSVRELQQNLRRVIARVERGQTLDVTRRSRPVARLSPLRAAAPRSPWPDLDRRALAVFGRKVVAPGPATQILTDRGDR